jgi:hypothetical protein
LDSEKNLDGTEVLSAGQAVMRHYRNKYTNFDIVPEGDQKVRTNKGVLTYGNDSEFYGYFRVYDIKWWEPLVA